MVKISFLGGCREVGASAVLIESNTGAKCILDYGIRFNENNRLPYISDLSNLKIVALSHCHIDHSGGLPYLYKNFDIPLLTNRITLRTTEILLKDMIKISKYPYPFGYRELKKLRENSIFLENGEKKKISEEFFLTFFNAGHIPGSVSILIEVDNKKILYTGDINTIDTNLIYPAKTSILPNIDALIIESTYALKDHPPRIQLEKEFIENVIDINDNAGRVLIPAFGVARSQEILLILNKYNLQSQIYLDGLSRKIGITFSKFPLSIRNFRNYKRALKKVEFVSKRTRNKIANKAHSIFISPSGMLKGGAAIDYIQKILSDPKSAIFLVGYQVEGTPGRKLLDEKIFEYQFKNNYSLSNEKVCEKAHCKVDYYDFSSHADRNQLFNYINSLKFNNNSGFVFCVHGDEKATTTFAGELANDGYNAIAPENKENYRV